MKIGIVGSGIAGLVAAYTFHRKGHQVTLLEKQSLLGMSAHEFEIQLEDELVRGDMPSRMFNQLQWPNLMALYDEIGVEIEPVRPTQSFSELGGSTYLNLNVAYRPQNVLATLLNPRNQRILRESKRLLKQGPVDLADGIPTGWTMGIYLKENNYSNDFKYRFLYPTLSSTVCTCSYRALDNYPAKIILSTLQNLTSAGLGETADSLLWKTKHGSSDVVSRLVDGITNIRLQTQVHAIFRDSDGFIVEHAPTGTPAQLSKSRFDQLIVATQANTALKIIRELREREREMLSRFSYETTKVAIHTDSSLMPSDRQNWATFNQVIRPDGNNNHAAMCTVHMNQFHANWRTRSPIFQTISPITAVDPIKLIATVLLQRPVVTNDSRLGWELRKDLHAQSNRRLWFCGSYARRGIPLLETAVNSVLDLELLNRHLPSAPSI